MPQVEALCHVVALLLEQAVEQQQQQEQATAASVDVDMPERGDAAATAAAAAAELDTAWAADLAGDLMEQVMDWGVVVGICCPCCPRCCCCCCVYLEARIRCWPGS